MFLMDARVKSAHDESKTASLVSASRRGAGLDQFVDDRIHQRLERRVDDVRRYAHRGPVLAVLVLALDQHARYGLGAGIEDPHAIIRKLESVDVLLIVSEVLGQR